MTNADKIYAALKELPKQTAYELGQYLEIPMGSVGSAIARLKREDRITEEKVINPRPAPSPPPKGWCRYVTGYSINPKPCPQPAKLTAPTENGWKARYEEAAAKLAELEAWKAQAIARYPDLGVEPIVLRARKLVAEQLREMGDAAHAQAVEQGKLDDKALVMVAVRALEA